MTFIDYEVELRATTEPNAFEVDLKPYGGRYRFELPATLEGCPISQVSKALWGTTGHTRNSSGNGAQTLESPYREPRRRSEAPGYRLTSQALGLFLYRLIKGDSFDKHLQYVGRLTPSSTDHKLTRLTLFFNESYGDVSPLMRLPWETLQRPSSTPIALDSRFSVVRKVVSISSKPPTFPKHIKLLVIAADVSGFEPISADAEIKELEALERENKYLSYEVIRENAFEKLRTTLRDGGHQILHFIGHGTAPSRHEPGRLVFKAANGGPDNIEVDRFISTITDQTALELVILNCCHGATATELNADVASRLALAGIPATLAMQEKLSDRAAVAFTHSFYKCLVDHLSPEEALVEARHAMWTTSRESIEWAKPVLYLQREISFRLQKPIHKRASTGFLWLIFLVPVFGTLSILALEFFGKIKLPDPKYVFPGVRLQIDGDLPAPPSGGLEIAAEGEEATLFNLDEDGKVLWRRPYREGQEVPSKLIVSSTFEGVCNLRNHEIPVELQPGHSWLSNKPYSLQLSRAPSPGVVLVQYTGGDKVWEEPQQDIWKTDLREKLKGMELISERLHFKPPKCELGIDLHHEDNDHVPGSVANYSVQSFSCNETYTTEPYQEADASSGDSGWQYSEIEALESIEREMIEDLRRLCDAN